MNLVAELNNEDTKIKKFQVFKNVSFDSTATVVVLGIAYFVMTRKTVSILKFFYLVILTFKESLVLVIENITEVHVQDRGKYF